MASESQIDESLDAPLEVPAAAFERVRALLVTEVAKAPAPAWRRQVTVVSAAIVGVVLVVAVLGMLRGRAVLDAMGQRVPVMTSLMASAVLAVFAALAPRRRWARWGALLSGVSAAALLLVARVGAPTENSASEWTCLVGQLLAGLPPLGFALSAARSHAPDPWRAVVLGVGVGATGALIGELLCGDGAMHAMRFHLPAWALVVAVCFVVQRLVRPRSYAP